VGVEATKRFPQSGYGKIVEKLCENHEGRRLRGEATVTLQMQHIHIKGAIRKCKKKANDDEEKKIQANWFSRAGTEKGEGWWNKPGSRDQESET